MARNRARSASLRTAPVSRFSEAVDALPSFLISEFEISEFYHRRSNGEWGDATGRDEAEERGAGFSRIVRPRINATLPKRGAFAEIANKSEPLDREQSADAERVEKCSAKRLPKTRDGHEARKKCGSCAEE